MEKNNTTSPYNDMLETPREGLVYQELISYEIRNGVTYKNIVSRTFHGNDYTDSKKEIPLR